MVEYKVLTHSPRWPFDAPAETLEADLNRLAEKGWRFCQFVPNTGESISPYALLIMERDKE